MRSLVLKLTIAFLLVGLTGSILVVVITQHRTRAAFSQFILNREQQLLVDNLVRYYQLNGSWEGVAERLEVVIGVSGELPPGPFDGRREFRRNWEGFTLIGPDGEIIYSRRPEQVGDRVSKRDLERAISLEANGENIGWLLLALPGPDWLPNSPEGLFLRNVNRAALLSALIAGILALALGGFLAITMTRSLRELTEATMQIAKGKLGLQVKIRSKDELGELAASFNRMSRDLQKANQARKQMTADIAHDLRSPLSVISGYSEALSEGKLPGTPEVYTILYQETQHLSRLVDDLRTLSLADAGELLLNRQPVDPHALLEQVTLRHAVTAKQKGVTLHFESGSVVQKVSVDPERMAQVLDNLLMNALRYTPESGEVVLDAGAANGNVRMQIRDTGSGITPEDLPHIFDRFYRGDKSRQGSGESGLGLAIAKSIVEAHGGTISAESMPDRGAVFTITLPAIGAA